jgi:DNA-binding beta-propeller fold protein YncE
VACDANAALLSIDLNTWTVLATAQVGDTPDVLAYDETAGRLYVAAESGWLTILDVHDRQPAVNGYGHLADDAHIVAVDPATHRSYYPVPHGSTGRAALLTYEPAP